MNNVCHSPWMFTNKVINPREDNWVTQSMKDTEPSEMAEWGFFHAYQLCIIHIIHIKIIINRYKAFLKPGILFLMWLLAGNIHFYLHPTTAMTVQGWCHCSRIEFNIRSSKAKSRGLYTGELSTRSRDNATFVHTHIKN